MYILTLYGKEEEGAYSAVNEDGDSILYIFEEEDDAVRFSLMLEEDEYPTMNVIEIEDEILLKTCDIYGYSYAIITKNDLVVPPKHTEKNDLV
jgi:hypothetical protein